MISPYVVDVERIGDLTVLPINLRKEQIKESPDIDTEKPVSRQQEASHFDYYDVSTSDKERVVVMTDRIKSIDFDCKRVNISLTYADLNKAPKINPEGFLPKIATNYQGTEKLPFKIGL